MQLLGYQLLVIASYSSSNTEASNSSSSTEAANQQLDADFLGEVGLVGADKKTFLASLDKIKIESTRVFRHRFTEITNMQNEAKQTLSDLQEQLDLKIIKYRTNLAECDREELTIERQNLTTQQIIKKKRAISLKRHNVKTQEAGAINTLQVQIKQIEQNLEKLDQTAFFLKKHQNHLNEQLDQVNQVLISAPMKYIAFGNSVNARNNVASSNQHILETNVKLENASETSEPSLKLVKKTHTIINNFINVYEVGYKLLCNLENSHMPEQSGSKVTLTTPNVSNLANFLQQIQTQKWCKDFLIDANNAILAYKSEKKASQAKVQNLEEKLSKKEKSSQSKLAKASEPYKLEQKPGAFLLELPGMSQSHSGVTEELMVSIGDGLLDTQQASRSVELSSESRAVSPALSRQKPFISSGAIVLRSKKTASS